MKDSYPPNPTHRIHVDGVRAFCSDLITDPLNHLTLYFLSIAGPQEAVRAIGSSAINGQIIDIYSDHDSNTYRIEKEKSYHVDYRRLPSSFGHALIYPKASLPNTDTDQNNTFLFFYRPGKNIPFLHLFFKHLNSRCEVPLLPEWTPWLFNKFKQKEWLTELRTVTGIYKGFRVDLNPDELFEAISQNIQEGNTLLSNWAQKPKELFAHDKHTIT